MPNAVTWAYARLNWTYHVRESGIPQQTLLHALMSFDLFACYLGTFKPGQIEPQCRDTIKRVAFPSRHGTVISKVAKDL